MNRPRTETAWWSALLVALVVLKAVTILLDPQVRLFLGDSASYLLAASSDWKPSERSFVYPMLIEALVNPIGDLDALPYWQALAGIGTALLLAWLLRRCLALPRGLVFVATCLFALEPAQLFYERMVLAEAFGLLAFAGFFAAASAYLARGRPAWLAATNLLGLAAVSLRLNYLPVVLVVSLSLPLLFLLDRRHVRPAWPALAGHMLIAVACFWGMHGQFRNYVGETFDRPPGYIGDAGFMRMGLVAPLIKPEHFVRAGLPADFAARLKFDLSDPRTRPAQLWTEGGLADALRQEKLDVDKICRKLSMYAISDDPFGVVRLGVGTLAGYFDEDSAELRLNKDLARVPEYPPDLIESVRTRWHADLEGVAQRWTPVSRLFAAGSNWLVACLFVLLPLCLANAVAYWRDPRRLQVAFGALVGIGLVATEVLFSNIASYRYLHAMPLFVLLNALPLGIALLRRRPPPNEARSQAAASAR